MILRGFKVIFVCSIFLTFVQAGTVPLAPFGTTIKIVSGEFVPMSGEGLVGGGIYPQAVQNALTKFNYNVNIEFMPWSRTIEEVKNGNKDMIFPITITEERKKSLSFSEVIGSLPSAIYTLKTLPTKMEDNIEDWRGKTMCRPQSFDLNQVKPLMDKYDLKLERPRDLGLCFRMMMAQKVDLVIFTEVVGDYWVKRIGAEKMFNKIHHKLGPIDFYIAFPKGQKSEELRSIIQKILPDVRAQLTKAFTAK